MRYLWFLLAAVLLGLAPPAAAQTPEKPPETPDWASLLGFDRPVAQARYDDERTPEGWAWARIRRDEIADLNLRCDPAGKTRLDSHDDAGWDEACRKIPANFVSDLLTVPRWRDRIGRHGVRLRGARIDGDLDLVNTEIRPELWIEASRIEGKLDLSGAHLVGLLSLQGTLLRGDFTANRLRSDGTLALRDRATFRKTAGFSGARVGGNIEMTGSAFEGTVDAQGASVEGNLFLHGGASFKGNVILRLAKIGGQLAMNGSTFEGTVDADGLAVRGGWFLRDGATFKGNVNLPGASVGGPVDIGGATFRQTVNAGSATIGQGLTARGARFAQPLDLTSLHIAGGLDLRGAVANRIDLTNAAIGGDLILGDITARLQWQCDGRPQPDTSWPLGDQRWRNAGCETGNLPAMILRNAHVGGWQDNLGSWPPTLDLEGFTYDRLGGAGEADLRQRSPQQWRDWLDRDRVFSVRPYTQLAGLLLAAGHRSTAETILYSGRERERDEALQQQDWYVWTWLTVLWAVAGYGIGPYAFRVLYWVGGLTALGTLLLLTARNARRRGLVWCFGASLQRLLPVVEFNQGCKDYFANPPAGEGEKRNLNGFQAVIFSLIALLGWGLGLVLLVAIGSPTPGG